MMNVVECKDVSKRYYGGTHYALKNTTFQIEQNKITGLIGRNGAGKSTLLKLIAGFMYETSGDIKVFGERPFNNLLVSANSIFVDDKMSLPATLNVSEILQVSGTFYEKWDHELAQRLFDYFGFHPKQSHQSLSKGKSSTFNMILGLASRCALTIFDEPTTGMDAAVRKDFYRALLKDYLANQRTIILSSHHMEEIEDIIEDVLLINEGKVVLHMPIEEFKEYAISFTGPATLVDEWLSGKERIHSKELEFGKVYAVVKNDFSTEVLDIARHKGLEVSNVSASDLSVYMTDKTVGGIDDVFK